MAYFFVTHAVAFFIPKQLKKVGKMKNKLVAIVLSVAVLAASAGGFVYFYNNNKDTSTPPTTTQTVTSSKISFSSDGKTVNYAGVEGQTLLATLESLTSVETQDSGSLGKMVIGINGVNSEKNKTYWAFYVNDAYANEGAGTLKAKAGDNIKVQLEEINL